MSAHRCPSCGWGTYLSAGQPPAAPTAPAGRYCSRCGWTGVAPALEARP